MTHDRHHEEEVVVSAVRGTGLEALRQRMAAQLKSTKGAARQLLGTTAARGRQSLTAARESLLRAIEANRSAQGDEFVAMELRAAHEALGTIVGAIYTDDILDRVFSRFCIGK